jgi:hypothetical protein
MPLVGLAGVRQAELTRHEETDHLTIKLSIKLSLMAFLFLCVFHANSPIIARLTSERGGVAPIHECIAQPFATACSAKNAFNLQRHLFHAPLLSASSVKTLQSPRIFDKFSPMALTNPLQILQ